MRAKVRGLVLLAVILGCSNPPTVTVKSLTPLARPAPAATTSITAEPATTTTSPPTTPPPAPTTAAPSTTPATAPPKSAPKPPSTPVAGGGVAIGDSVLEDVQIYAKDTLTSRGIGINAAVSRQWRVGIQIATQLKAAGKLPPLIIVALGSNGVINPAMFDQMMQACAGAQRVVFMTVTGPLIANNPIIIAGVDRYPNATLADWAALAAGHTDWFGADHVHIGPAGAAALGNLLASKA